MCLQRFSLCSKAALEIIADMRRANLLPAQSCAGKADLDN